MSAPRDAQRRVTALTARWLTAAVGLPVIGGALWAGGIWWTALMTLVMALALAEWMAMLRAKGIRPASDTPWIGAALLLGGVWAHMRAESGIVPSLGIVILAAWAYVALREITGGGGFVSHGWVILALAVVIGGLGHLILLRQSPNGITWTLMTLGVTWSTDTAAFFVGRSLRGAPLAPRISPNKTISGAMGGLAGAALWMGFAAPVWLDIPAATAALLGIGLGCLSQSGDLLESSFKRYVGVKDSGHILPGHGGVLDRFDSLILTAPAMYYIQLFLSQS